MDPLQKGAEIEDEELAPEELAALSRIGSEESFPIEDLIPEFRDA